MSELGSILATPGRPLRRLLRACHSTAAEKYNLALALTVTAAFAGYTTISVFRYLRLDAGSWDLGIFTEYVKQIAGLHSPVVDARTPGMNILGDHFSPIVALISPFFQVFPGPATLLVAQALLVAISIIPIWRAAKEKLGPGSAQAVATAYGFSWGLQKLVNLEFHELAFAVPLLAFSMSALVRNQPRAAALWALPLVFVKEDQGIAVAVVGLLIATINRKRRLGLGVTAWGLGWAILAVAVIIPHFNPGHIYPYMNKLSPSGQAFSIARVMHRLLTGFGTKARTLVMILLPTVFLALRSPLLLVAAPDLLLRFLSTDSSYWGTDWHYNAPVMPVVFVAAIDAIARIRNGLPLRNDIARLGSAMMAGVCLALAFYYPISSLWDPATYQIGSQVTAARHVMALVPDNATVATNIDLLAPLAARTDAYWLGNSVIWQGSAGNPATKYVIYDQNSFDLPSHKGGILAYVEQLSRGSRYRMLYASDGVFLFVRA